MRQFGIYELRQIGSARRRPRLVLVIQHDRADAVRTRVVVPLYRLSEIAIVDRLTVDLELDGEQYRASFDQPATLDIAALGPEVGFQPHLRDELIRALDFLFTSF